MEEVGGQVLEIEAADATALVAELHTEFQAEAVQLDQTVRIDGDAVHELVPEVMKRFGDRIRRLQLAHPSLEDVFLQRTGKRFVVADPQSDLKKGKKKKRRRS